MKNLKKLFAFSVLLISTQIYSCYDGEADPEVVASKENEILLNFNDIKFLLKIKDMTATHSYIPEHSNFETIDADLTTIDADLIELLATQDQLTQMPDSDDIIKSELLRALSSKYDDATISEYINYLNRLGINLPTSILNV